MLVMMRLIATDEGAEHPEHPPRVSVHASPPVASRRARIIAMMLEKYSMLESAVTQPSRARNCAWNRVAHAQLFRACSRVYSGSHLISYRLIEYPVYNHTNLKSKTISHTFTPFYRIRIMSYPAYYHRKIEQFWFLPAYCHYCACVIRHCTTLGWSFATLHSPPGLCKQLG